MILAVLSNVAHSHRLPCPIYTADVTDEAISIMDTFGIFKQVFHSSLTKKQNSSRNINNIMYKGRTGLLQNYSLFSKGPAVLE